MVRKKLVMAILALSALQADLANAVGLGSLSVKSALNQPLNAEIRLLETGDLDPTQIKVVLAAPEDFERAGVDRNYFLTNLKFAIDMDGRGSGTIHITTRDPVVEPYLNFVVEARWPNGRLLREFAVLLDPPTFSAGTAQPIASQPAAAPVAQATRQLEPPKVSSVPAASSTADQLESNTLPAAASSSEHRVQVSETLGQIAARHRPGSDVSVQQTMVAIQRANPDAFIRNNINLIKSGSVLRLPSADDVRAVDAAQAAQDVSTQSHSWRSGASSAESANGPQLDASQSQSAATNSPQEKERLTIATPGNSAKATVGEGSGASGKGLEALRNQLASSQESLDSAKRDNKEMQSRLDDMERQVATLQRLISLKDDQLSALQAKSSAQGSAAPAAAAVAPSPAAPSTPEAAPTSPEASTAATETAPVAAAPVPAPKPVTQAVKPIAKPVPVAQPSLLDQLTGNPLYLGGGLGALALLIGGAVFMKKRREQAQEDEDAYQALDINDYDAEPSFDEAHLDTALVSDDAVFAADEPRPAATEPEKKPLRSETGDAIAEADIYIAYGRYQQAVDLLTGAIDGEPDRTDLRVKLLEVFLEMRNREAFRQQFMSLQSLGDGDAVVQVKEMLSSVDGVSDWLNDLPQATASMPMAGSVAGMAAGAAAAFAGSFSLSEPAVEQEPSVSQELDLDLDDLDLDDIPATEAAQGGENVAGAGAAPAFDALDGLDDLELDLDLDDSTFSESSSETPAPQAPVDVDSFSSTADDLSFDLDDEELDLDLNEDDLDFALKAMEGTPAVAADTDTHNSFDAAPAGLEFSNRFDSGLDDLSDADDLELDDLAANTDSDFSSTSDLSDFDLSLPSDDLGMKEVASTHAADDSMAADLKAMEADLGSLSELEGLGADLGGDDAGGLDELADFNFELDTSASTVDNIETNATFAELDVEPVAEAPAAPINTATTGDDFDFLADTDEVATKLDLARAYIDMGDTDGAKDILDEVLTEGSEVQQQEASELLGRIA